MRNRSKSTLFLIEQLIVIAVFAICASACISLLTTAYFNARESRDVSNALIVAESAAESFKAFSGDFERTAAIMNGRVGSVDGAAAVIVYFDDRWLVSGQEDAHFILRLVSVDQQAHPPLLTCELTVEALEGGEELLAFPVVVRPGASG
jgi:Tfp pilus assembly protein PilV